MDTTLVIAEPDQPYDCYLGGRGHDIPVVRFREGISDLTIQVSNLDLTPAEQKTWLTSLAREIQLLAASIPVNDEPDDEPDAQVRSILGGAVI